MGLLSNRFGLFDPFFFRFFQCYITKFLIYKYWVLKKKKKQYRISKESLKPGDHIYSWRTAYIYAHHGTPSPSSCFFCYEGFF